MKRAFSTICATALSVTLAFSSIVPSYAAPIMPGKIAVDSSVDQVRQVKRRPSHNNNWNKPNRPNRPGNWNRPNRPGNWNRPSRPGSWNGHSGYRNSRSGYRRHNDGWWYPLAAFAAGAAIIGATTQPAAPGARTMNQSHINWCANKYRSYRSSDNSYQPYNGPRAQCFSPY